MAGTATRLGRLLLAFERHDAAWRTERGFTANERMVLLLLADGGPASPTSLSEIVGVTTAGMTGLLDRLEAERYVTRRRHPDDGRRVMVAPTKRALRLLDDRQRFLERLVEDSGLATADAQVVGDFLDQVANGLSRTAEPG